MEPHGTIRRGLLVWLLAAWAAPVTAQNQPVGAMPISLADGVRQSLEQARLVRLAREDVNIQQAAVRQARGAFDSIVQIGPLYEHREDNIENTEFLNPERVKRGFAHGLNVGFGLVADALAEQIRQGRGDLPLCPIEGTFSSYVATLPGSLLPVPLCRPASLSLGVQTLDPTNKSFLLRQPLSFEPMSSYLLQVQLASAFRVQISTASLEARERSNELLQTLESAARIVEVKAGLIFDRLGPLPEFVYSDTTSLFAQFTKPLRNGSVFQFKASFDGRSRLFRDKPIDPSFGGTDVPNSFGNRLEAAWLQPLKRGRGGQTVQAALRAATKNFEASRFSFEQVSADQTLSTGDAYIALMMAQESLALTRESLNNQRRTLDNTIRLVGAGDVASADLARARARTSEVEADVETQRLAVVSAQATLADAMGVASDQLMTLVASDVFPVRPLELDIDALSREAVMRRADVQAATAQSDASRILLAAARADTRSRFDVRFSGGYAQTYFGPTFHSLGDENGVHLTNDDYLRYYNPGGFGRAFRRPWQPIGAVTATFELPLGNNQRLGRLAQASASARESDIRVADLSRSIQNNVPKIGEEVRRARAEWEQRQEAVIQYEATWDVAQRLRAAGDLTLIDTLLTEQLLTQARLLLVQAKGEYASAVSRFRRETGTIVDITDWSRPQPNLAGIVEGR